MDMFLKCLTESGICTFNKTHVPCILTPAESNQTWNKKYASAKHPAPTKQGILLNLHRKYICYATFHSLYSASPICSGKAMLIIHNRIMKNEGK